MVRQDQQATGVAEPFNAFHLEAHAAGMLNEPSHEPEEFLHEEAGTPTQDLLITRH
jgi:hypothetical protein